MRAGAFCIALPVVFTVPYFTSPEDNTGQLNPNENIHKKARLFSESNSLSDLENLHSFTLYSKLLKLYRRNGWKRLTPTIFGPRLAFGDF